MPRPLPDDDPEAPRIDAFIAMLKEQCESANLRSESLVGCLLTMAEMLTPPECWPDMLMSALVQTGTLQVLPLGGAVEIGTFDDDEEPNPDDDPYRLAKALKGSLN